MRGEFPRCFFEERKNFEDRVGPLMCTHMAKKLLHTNLLHSFSFLEGNSLKTRPLNFPFFLDSAAPHPR